MTPEVGAAIARVERWLAGDYATNVKRELRILISAYREAERAMAVPSFWWVRGGRTKPATPFATKLHDVHWLVQHADGSLDTFAYETPEIYLSEGESVVEYRRAAIAKGGSQ